MKDENPTNCEECGNLFFSFKNGVKIIVEFYNRKVCGKCYDLLCKKRIEEENKKINVGG